MNTTDARIDPVMGSTRRRASARRLRTLGVAFAMATSLVVAAAPAQAQTRKPGDTVLLDFTASAPVSYSHYTGGGFYRTGTQNTEVIESLEGAQFACGDVVSFLTQIKIQPEAATYGPMTLQLHYQWGMAGTGKNTGVGYSNIVATKVNYAAGPTGETGISDDGGSVASVVETHTSGAMWQPGAVLYGTIAVNDLEADETVILRTDVKLKCDPAQADSNGTLQAALDDAFVTAVSDNNGTVVPSKANSGQQTVPMNSPGGIHYPQISLSKTVTTAAGACPGVDELGIDPGATVKYCYDIFNPSDTLNPPGRPILQVRLTDDNGTPGNTADDIHLTAADFTGLVDADGSGGNNDLLPGAHATASVLRPVTETLAEGQFLTNTAVAYGDDAVIDPYTLSYSDWARVYIIVAHPAIDVVKETALSASGPWSDNPLIIVGQPVYWRYTVTNIGDVALHDVTVVDNPAETITCPKTTLAVAEEMICTAQSTAIIGTRSNTATVQGYYNGDSVTATDGSSYFGGAPSIDIQKTPDTQTVHPGETATFTITVTNTGNLALNNVVVTDALAPACAASLGSLAIAGTASYSCSIANVQAPFTNVAVVNASYDGTPVTDNDSAYVDVDYLPDITVVKTANPTSIPESGAPVTFTVAVTNNSVEPFILDTLSDDRFGPLSGNGTCSIPQTIAAAATYTCTFTETLTSDTLTPHTDVVTAAGHDEQANRDSATDDATVTFTNVLPVIIVTKSANPTSVPETGANVEFTVTVHNDQWEAVTLQSLTDNVFGDLNGKGTCLTGGVIAAGATYSCAFTGAVPANTDITATHIDTVTAVAFDNEGSSDTKTASATVGYTNVPPTIVVTKTASKTSVTEFGETVTYTVTVQNTSWEPVQLTALSDDKFGALAGKGTCALNGWIASGATYTCAFGAWVAGEPAAPHVNVVSATVTDNDSSTATGTDDATVNFVNVPPSITVTKSANPTVVSLGGGPVLFTVTVHNNSPESATLTVLSDDKFGNLAGQGTCAVSVTIAGNATYTCTFTGNVPASLDPTAVHIDTVTATVMDNDGTYDTKYASATVGYTWYGRTPGYWKNHPELWPTPYAPTQLVTSLFSIPAVILNEKGQPDATDTLAMALAYKGGSTNAGAAQILLRAAVAAVMNEQYYGVQYPAASVATLVTSVNAALASVDRATMLALATTLDYWNNANHNPLP